MVTSPIATLVQSALDREGVEEPEIAQMRKVWEGSSPLQAEDADALFALQGRLGGRNARFNALFDDMLLSYILDGDRPRGSISKEKAAWLLSMLDGGEGLVANPAELEFLFKLVETADAVPDNLASFALHQIQHSAMTGEGPAARGRIHFSRVVDAQDVANLARLFQVAKGDKRRIISRLEADILFELAEACTDANDAAWDKLFAETLQAHLLHANQPGLDTGVSLTTPVVLDDRDSAWLQQRIQHDGQVSRAERALLALVDPRQMAAAGSWNMAIGQML